MVNAMKIKDIYPDVIAENLSYEYKAVLNPDNPVKWAKTIVGFANDKGGILFVGVSNNGDAFGINLEEIDKTKLLISRINDRNIFPHVKITYMMRSVDDSAELFVLAVKVFPSESVVRYREGDYTETKYQEKNWTQYIHLCKQYRFDQSAPSIKELQNEEIISSDGYVKSGFIMFSDDYDRDDTMICCRLWKGKNKTGTVLDSSRLRGSLANVFEEGLNFIERNTKTGWVKNENGGREEIRSYPKEAIREALVNAIAHRDYSIYGTQIDIDIYSDRIEIVSPGSWLLPKDYNDYPTGTIPSIRRNSIIVACLDVANLMERGGTGFQTMIEAYKDCPLSIQPVVSIYPGFLNLKLYDKLANEDSIELDLEEMTNPEKAFAILKMQGPKSVKELQEIMKYKNRSQFLKEVINPLIESEKIYRDGKPKSPTSLMKIKKI